MSPDSTHSHDVVTAVIVAHDGAAWLPRVMDSLTKQTRSVQRVVGVDTGSTDRSGSMLAQAFGRSVVFGMEGGTGYGAAVAKALRHRAANAHVPMPGAPRDNRAEWIWLLHDDSEPAPDALERLLAAAREAPAAAVFGPKIMDWNDRDILLEAGTTIDRAGRRITGIEPREVDQGQHDGDRDVLAVSSAGMLVRREVWDEVGGFDPAMRLFREDTDFCWRVQAAGHRVRVVTGAVVYHVEATARNRREAPAAEHRRRQDRRNALLVLAGNLPARPMLSALAGNMVLSMLRTIFFLLAKRPAAARDEMAAYTSVAGHPLRLHAVRRIRAQGRQQAFARLGTQLPPGRSFRMLAEYATSTLSKTLPAEAVGSHHATDDPSDDDSLLVDTGLAQRLLTSPGVLLFLTLTVVALVAERSLLGSAPLGGGALIPAWGGVSGLWQEYFQGFHPVSIGTTASTPPYVPLVAALATVLGGKPWLAVDVILLGCVPLAGTTAFLATRRVTTFAPARVIGALGYALLPVGMGAVAAGRLGTAVLLVLLPPTAVLAGRIFTAPRRRARRAAWAASLLTAVVAAFVPLFWLITALVMGTGVIALRRRARALDAMIVVLVPPLLLLPWALDIAAHPARIFLEAGLARPGLAAAGLAPRSLLLLSPGGPGLPPHWVTGGLFAVATIAVVASGRRGLVLAGWAVGAAGLIIAAAVSRIAISQAGMTAPVRAWPGPALAVAGAGLLLAVVAAGDRMPRLLRSGRWHTPAGLAVLGLGAVACSAPALAAAYWVTSGVTGPVRPAAGPLLPEFVSVSSDTGQRLRTLVLQTAPHGTVTYLVLRDSDPLLGSPELALPAAAGKALSQCVATLTAPSGSAVTDQGRALAGFGIGYVLMPAPVNAGLARLLDNVPGLRPVSVTPAFQLWRVVDTTARVTVTGANGTLATVSSGPVSVSGARAPAAGGTLTLAEPAGGWSATLNGHPLTPLAAPVNGWAQGFRLPPGGGTLSVTHSEIGREAAVVLEGLAVLVVAGLGMPGARTVAEAEEEPARENKEPAVQEAGPGRRRAGRGRDTEERSRRRRLPRRSAEPELPPGTEVPRPARPARALSRAAAVPAGIRAGWLHRGEPPGPEEPFPGEAAGPGEQPFPDSEPPPASPSPSADGPAHRGPLVPAQPAPASRGHHAAAAPSGETIAHRARAGDAAGRHSHRAGAAPQAGPGPGTDPGRPGQEYGPPAGPERDDAGPGGDTVVPSRGRQDAPRGRGFGPRRARRDSGAPTGPGGYPGVRRVFGGRSAPEAGAAAPGDEPQGDGEARERFALPIRRGGAGAERTGRFGRGGRGSPPTAPARSQPGTRGGPPDSGGYDTGGHPSGPYPAGSYQGGRSADVGSEGGAEPSGPYPSGSYQDARPTGGGAGGGYETGGHPSGPYPAGSYQGGGRSQGGDAAGGGEPSGPYPSGSYQGARPPGGGYDSAGPPGGPYPAGSYQGGGRSADAGFDGGAEPSGPSPSGSYQDAQPAGGYNSGGYDADGHPSGPYPAGSYRGGGRSADGFDGGAEPSGPYPSGSYQDAQPAGGGAGGGYATGGHPSGPYPAGSYDSGRSQASAAAGRAEPSGSYQGARPAGGYDSGRDDGGRDDGGGHPSYPAGSYDSGRSPGDGADGGAEPSGPYPSGAYQGAQPPGGGVGGGGVGGGDDGGDYDSGDPGSGPYPVGSYEGGGRYPGGSDYGGGGRHSSGPYPSGTYRGDRSPGGHDSGDLPSGSYPTGSSQGGRPPGGAAGGHDSGGPYPGGSHLSESSGGGDESAGYESAGYESAGYESAGESAGHESPGSEGGSHEWGSRGTAPGSARRAGRGRRGRSPGHARVSRPGTPGPAGPGAPEGDLQPPGPGEHADEDGALSPLPPLPPRAPRRGPWDDREARDDQGEADW